METDGVNKREAARARVEAQRRPRNPLWYGVIGGALLLGVALAIILASGGGDSKPNPNNPSNGTASKDSAYNFSFALYQGEGKLGAKTLNLSDLQGKPVVLNFWAGLCPPCRAEMPDLQRFYQEFNDQVTLIGIDIGQFIGLGDQHDAENLLSNLQITYPAGYTEDGSVVREYEVFSMPTTVFINSNGEVFKTWRGLLNRDVLAEVTTEMLNQESVLPG